MGRRSSGQPTTRGSPGVTAAAQGNRFAAGVRQAGDQKWQNNTITKGPQRCARGVQIALGRSRPSVGDYVAIPGSPDEATAARRAAQLLALLA
jgi:hypothetical protein